MKAFKKFKKLIILSVFFIFLLIPVFIYKNQLSFIKTTPKSATVYFTRPIENGRFIDYSLWKLDVKTKQTQKIADITSSSFFHPALDCMELFQISKSLNRAIVCKDGDLFQVDLTTGELKRLTQLAREGTSQYEPVSASPAAINQDGTMLAFELTGYVGGIDGGLDVYPDIKPGLWVLNLKTNEVKGPLYDYKSSLSSCCGSFHFTNDGKSIVFWLAAEEKLKIINIEKSQISDFNDLPYSNSISFNSEKSCTIIASYKPFIYDQFNLETLYMTDGNLNRIRKIIEFDQNVNYFSFPLISPDCRKVIFNGKPIRAISQKTGFNISNISNFFTRKIEFNSNGNGDYFGWLPDNKTVMYISGDNGDIFSMDTETNYVEQYTRFGDIDRWTARIIY